MVRSEPIPASRAPHLLVIDGHARRAARVIDALRAHPWPPPVIAAVDSLAALRVRAPGAIDVAIVMHELPDGHGRDALRMVRSARADAAAILVVPPDGAATAARSMPDGAADLFVLTDDTLPVLPFLVQRSLRAGGERRESAELRRRLEASQAELETRNRAFEEMIAQLEHKVRTDELTGLGNRRWFNLVLEGSWAEADRHDLPIGLLMIDLDGFKHVNDQAGHQLGDEILRLVGSVIRQSCRRVDTAARFGGDEFCVLLPHTLPDDAARVARRIHEVFHAVVQRRFPGTPVTMTVGVAHRMLSRPGSARELLAHADAALYAGKAAGRDRVVVNREAPLPGDARSRWRPALHDVN